jgi:hypothetical protein
MIAIPGTAAAADCGKLNGGTVKTKGGVASCRKARAIVKEFMKTRKSAIQGYKCGGSSQRIECRLDRKRIIWSRR